MIATSRNSFFAVCSFMALIGFGHSALGEPAPRAAARPLGKTCAAEIIRFCPSISETPLAARSQAICLKPYKSSLSLGCRRAVKALYP